MLPGWNNLSFTTKLSLLTVVLLFFAVPVTVLSVNNLRDSRSKAACVGDCYYPDPVVSWTKEPYYQIETCVNTTQRGSIYCRKYTQTGGNSIGNIPIAGGFTNYYWVDTLLFSTYPNVEWVSYANGTKSCGSSSNCNTTISWTVPVQTAQATNAGDVTRNPCGGGAPASCSSTQNVTYPSKTTQFVDFPPNIGFDVYIYIKGKLFDIKPGNNSGAAAAFNKPTLISPVYGDTAVTNNPNFQWSSVPTASKYAVWVSESNDFGSKPYWATTVQQTSCSTNCSKFWGSGGWTSQNGAAAAPGILPAKQYYWLVWACLSTTCPTGGLSSISNFTIQAPSLGAPTLQYPIGTQAENNPIFKWTPVSGSVGSYGIGVSDIKDILSFTGLWRTAIRPNLCTNICQKAWNNGNGWFQYPSTYAKPFTLVPGKTYYWYVWSCDQNGGCPLTSISKIQSFTIPGGIGQIAPALISPAHNTTVSNGVTTFIWNPAGGASIDRYKVVLKYNDPNFSTGSYFQKDVSPQSCNAKSNCSTDMSSGWTWVPGSLAPRTMPNPLNSGRWFWMVIACKTQACGLADILASGQNGFNVPTGNNSAVGLGQIVGNCKANGKVDTVFAWTPVSTASAQVIYLSTQNNNFAPGTYLSTSLTFPGVSPTRQWSWNDLLANANHYWKISTQVNGSWYDSPTATFKTPVCQVSGGLQFDLEKPGTDIDIVNYLYSVAGNDIDPKTGLNLGDVLTYVMMGNGGVTLARNPITGPSPNGESGAGDCAFNSGTYLGIFQYDASTWQGQSNYGSHEDADNYDSGSYGRGACWKNPGVDSGSWNREFGGTNDANAWDPYAQVRATRAMFLAKQYTRWQVYTDKWGF